MRFCSKPIAACALVAASVSASPSNSGAQADTIRGRVRTDSGLAVRDAEIAVTILTTQRTEFARSDSTGAFAVVLRDAIGEYLVYVRAGGMQPFRQRLTRGRSDTTFAVDVQLKPAVITIPTVRVVATRPRPVRRLAGDPTPGTDGNERTFDGLRGVLAPDTRGELAAMAATIPGIALTSDGLSAFGIGPEQNSVALNGMSFPGATLPRDAPTTVRFQLSPWDPTVGGFSGIRTSTFVAVGSGFSSRRAHLTLDAPPLQVRDSRHGTSGQEFSSILGSVGGNGPLGSSLSNSYGADIAWRRTPVSALPVVDDVALFHAGIDADSVRRAIAILRSLGVPFGSGRQMGQSSFSASYIDRIDNRPGTATDGSPKRAWWVTTLGRYSTTRGSQLSPTATNTIGNVATNAVGTVQANVSNYFGAGGYNLNELTSAISISDNSSSPALQAPSGSVTVYSPTAAGGSIPGVLRFGGSGVDSRVTRVTSFEIVDQSSILPTRQRGQSVKLYAQARLDHLTSSGGTNHFGSFTYASLSDLDHNRPDRFDRVLTAPTVRLSELVSALALASNWSTGTVQMTGGVRGDATFAMWSSSKMTGDERLLGFRASSRPRDLSLSPRLGFTWDYQGRGSRAEATSSELGTVFRGGRGIIRGGIGEFVSTIPTSLLAEGSTGTPTENEVLRCLDQNAPSPDWRRFEESPQTIPTACLDIPQSTAAFLPSASYFSDGYRAPRSWRASLGWTNTIRDVYLAVDGTLARNANQPSRMDANFKSTTAFALVTEQGRPVYVSPSSISATSGLASLTQSRRIESLGQITERLSDMRGISRQLTAYAIPTINKLPQLVTLIGYTYFDGRSTIRGFDGSTDGDPLTPQWSKSSLPKHTVQLQIGTLIREVGISAFIRVSSPRSFTPLVAGDINGDGLSNDRPFIFDPKQIGDSAFANDQRTLLAGHDGQCLLPQLGRIAGPNSCSTGWTTAMNASALIRKKLPGIPRRANISLNFANPLGGLDYLIHGASAMRGWGANVTPDPIVYTVTGFDPSTRSFRYKVNQSFGSSRRFDFGRLTPFRVSVDVAIDLGRSVSAQQLDAVLRPSGNSGGRAPTDSLQARLMRSGFTDIYGTLLRLSDSLLLSRVQIGSFQDRRARLVARVDSVYHGLASYLSALPARYDGDEAVRRVARANDAAWDILYEERPFLRQVLAPTQVALLPRILAQFITSEERIRFFGI